MITFNAYKNSRCLKFKFFQTVKAKFNIRTVCSQINKTSNFSFKFTHPKSLYDVQSLQFAKSLMQGKMNTKGSLSASSHSNTHTLKMCSFNTGTIPIIVKSKFRSILTDQKRRTRFKSRELKHNILKSCLASRFGLNLGLRAIDYRRIYKSWWNTHSITRVRNRCIVSGHPTSVANFRLSRISLRHYAHRGRIPGLTKCLNK